MKTDRIAVHATPGQPVHEQVLVVADHIPGVALQLLEQEAGGLAHVQFVGQGHLNSVRVFHGYHPVRRTAARYRERVNRNRWEIQALLKRGLRPSWRV